MTNTWEYSQLQFSGGTGLWNGPSGETQLVELTDALKFLNQLGQQGWELTAAGFTAGQTYTLPGEPGYYGPTAQYSPGSTTYLLKRPGKPEGRP